MIRRFTFISSILLCILAFYTGTVRAQNSNFDEDQLGAWYMYFWSLKLKDSRFGFQGDIQFRNWDLVGDLEQLLLRSGLTYIPKNTNLKFTLGYAYILSGEFGESTETSDESRIYQEALLPQKIGSRTYITHRFRFEQRWVEGQDLRTRFRYALFINVPFNRKELTKGAVYYAFYNELFINGQRDIGDGRQVELFDRNRFYNAVGYAISDKVRVQGGYMIQTTDDWSKGQIQLSLHHSI